MKIHRNWIMAACIAAIAAGIYSIYWVWMAGHLERMVVDWVGVQRDRGAVVQFRWAGVVGFPLAFETVFHEPRIETKLANGAAMSWRGKSLVARMRPWNPTVILFADPAPQEWRIGNAADVQLGRITSGGVEGFLTFRGSGTVSQVKLMTWNLTVDSYAIGTAGAQRVEIGAQFPGRQPRDYREILISMAMSAENISVPISAHLPYGQVIDRASLIADILGPVPAAPLLPGLTVWRDTGGTLEIRRLEFQHGPLTVRGDATLALDAELQPMGSGRFEAVGLAEAIGALADQGSLNSGPAGIARSAIKALERRGSDGQMMAEIGLSLQDGVLRLGPIMLLHLPRLRWQ